MLDAGNDVVIFFDQEQFPSFESRCQQDEFFLLRCHLINVFRAGKHGIVQSVDVDSLSHRPFMKIQIGHGFDVLCMIVASPEEHVPERCIVFVLASEDVDQFNGMEFPSWINGNVGKIVFLAICTPKLGCF